MKEMRGMHPLIHVAFLNVNVPVEVDDPEVAVDKRRDPADIRIRNRVVTPNHDRKASTGEDVPDAAVDLVECFLDVRGDDKYVPSITKRQFLKQVYA